MQYHIIEIQRRPDGVNNVLEIVSRNSLATGLSFFYDRCSKMAASTLFVSVTIVLIDSDGQIIENKKLPTSYQEQEA